MLERVGDPADVAAEAREPFGIPAGPTRQPAPWLEVIALIALVIPFAGWLVGVILLLWVSASGPPTTSASAPSAG